MPGAAADWFGAASVSAMAIAHGLERRGPVFVLLFSLACLASSVYAAWIRSWPFAVVELLWAATTLRRWQLDPRRSP